MKSLQIEISEGSLPIGDDKTGSSMIFDFVIDTEDGASTFDSQRFTTVYIIRLGLV